MVPSNGLSPRAHKAGGIGLLLSLLSAVVGATAPAMAACNQELAVYSEPDAQAALEFTPAATVGAALSFRLLFPENSVILDGVVMWTEGVARPHGILMHKCPEGDVTGEELDACTVWQGVVYAVDDKGKIGLLPQQGQPAAAQLLLPDLAPSLRQSTAYGVGGISKLPWDGFVMSGCQE